MTSNEQDRKAAVIVIHGNDGPVALGAFAGWIKEGKAIGFEKISRLSDAIAEARRQGEQVGLEKAARVVEEDMEAHEAALHHWEEPPATDDPAFVQFYADEFVRQCCSSNARKIRELMGMPGSGERESSPAGVWG